MTLGIVGSARRSAAGHFCSCCGTKMMRHFSENAVVSQNQINQIISENFLTVKGAAVFLPRGNGSSPSSVPRITQRWNKHAGDLQQHLQSMFTLLRPEDNIRLAVRLESAYANCTRYMVVVTTNGRQDTEESVVLGVDFTSCDSSCSLGLVLPLWSDTLIHLDGDGGFSVSTVNRVHVFKPVSVQAMWSALQSLHKACEVARCHNYYPGSLFLTWVSYYQSRVASDQACINEWNAMQDVQSHRADSPVLFTDVPTERERTERLIKTRLREIMMQKDLENVTSKEIRTELEMQMVCNLREFKEFLDNEMIVILGQMDSATEIFDHVYLGSEWNASNLEELQNSGVRYILNVTREIDNFFPGMFEYHNIRVYDEEATNLLEYWNDTYKFISKAKKAGAKCLVHCKMGVSRSASTVIAYAMKEYGWDLEHAFDHVKERRTVAKPNPSFMRQLEEYQGILLASKQRHNKLWRSHSDSDLSERHDPHGRAPPPLGRSDPHNNNNAVPSLQDLLGIAVLQALAAETSGVLAATRVSEPPATGAFSRTPVSSKLGDSKETPPSSLPLCHEDPLLPPMPRPRAATVVPEEKAEGMSPPIALLSHPLPSSSPLSPPSPATEPKLEGAELHTKAAGWTQPSTSVPEQNSLPSALPGPHVKDPQAALSRPRSIGPNKLPRMHRYSDLENGQVSPVTPMAVSPLSPSELCLATVPRSSDDNNNPSSSEPGSAPNTSRLSTDSIDFFSAREKFLGLSQDGQTSLLGEQAMSRTAHARSPSQDVQPGPLEDPRTDEGGKECPSEAGRDASCGLSPGNAKPQQDNGICVRHIVTELESISSSVPPATQLGPRGPLQEVEPKAKDSETVWSLSPPSAPQSPSTPPADWQSGSVRRATEQLEQRIHQKSGQAAGPRQSATTAQRNSLVSVEKEAEHVGQLQKECREERGHKDSRLLTREAPGHPSPFASNCSTSRLSHDAPGLKPLETSVRLKGVTELETDTDVDTVPGGPSSGCSRLQAHSRQELEKIQETLWELQAFLQEAGRLAGVGGAGGEEPVKEVGLDPGGLQRRAVELEARIRQAGLTPPSLMKRSASLAKLDCLELSTNDLSDWDLHPPATSPSSPHSSSSILTPWPRPHSVPDDASKKQRVLPLWPPRPCSAPEDSHRVVGPRHCDHNPSHSLCPQGRGTARSQEAGSATPSASAPVQSAPHGKPHPLRRPRKPGDRKKVTAFLYNTM